MNFFLINEAFRFVDLSGYGYARAPKEVKAKWSAAATDCLAKRDREIVFWDKPVAGTSPQCGAFLLEKITKKGTTRSCANETCG